MSDLNSQRQVAFLVGQLVRPFTGLERGELGVVEEVSDSDPKYPYLVRIAGGRNRYAASELLRVWIR